MTENFIEQKGRFMPTIDENIRRIDNVICRHLDNIEDSSRGAISQDILEQLMKFINHIMLKFYADGASISINEENIAKATEYAQINSELSVLYKFSNFLKSVTTQFTLDEDGSERLMLKYYQYLLETKDLLDQYYGINILHNLEKFPLRTDATLQEYYTKISEKINQYPANFTGDRRNKYYIQKVKPLFVNGQIYREITFAPVDDRKNKSKTNRVIAFTKLRITKRYASSFRIVSETIEILGKTMPINIIVGWEISIRDCEFQNFISLIEGKREKVSRDEQRIICKFLTEKRFTLNDLMEFPDYAYDTLTTTWRNQLRFPVFIDVLDYCRNIIRSECAGKNLLRYLLYSMNNAIIKNQRGSTPNSNLSNLYIMNGSIQFDNLPFNRSPIGHNPKSGTVFNCIPCNNRQPELFARFIRNNTEIKGQLFTDITETDNFDNINELIRRYNDSLWFGHKPRSNLMLENNQVFINEYKIDTCTVIKKLQELSASGIKDYHDDVECWLFLEDYEIDCREKRHIISQIFSESKVGVIYGSAGVGKSTLINHVSHYFDNEYKLYLTQTNPAKENLMQKIDAENTIFSTIASFLNQESGLTEYGLLVIDECSTVSNSDMVAILNTAKFKALLLVGDTYQIDSIQFGNWFSVLRSFLPESAIFELTTPHRTENQELLELWKKVRNMEDDTKEVIERESCSLKVDTSLLSAVEKDEAILCLNYDGLYGINNINRFLQESNPNPAFKWDIQQYKVGDPVLFLESDRFRPVIYNNMKGTIVGIKIIDEDTINERIRFDIELGKKIEKNEAMFSNLQLLECEDDNKSVVRFYVHKVKSVDEDGDENNSRTIVPFQVAYAVSIHKAQGLEYNSVKIVITDEVEELVTHNVFYTAITRAREKLKIYWTPETEEKVISRIKPRDISRDVEILKTYLN